MNTLKYYRNRNIDLRDLTKEAQLRYQLENGNFSFNNNLEETLKVEGLELPSEFIFTNNASNATSWVIYFQDLGYKVDIEKRKYENFGTYGEVIVMVCSKQEETK